jgi:hypothetical protein
MRAVSVFLNSLNEWQKAVTALMGSFAMGAAFYSMIFNLHGLPQRVDEIERRELELADREDALELRVGNLEAKLDQAICLLTLPADTERSGAIRSCGL